MYSTLRAASASAMASLLNWGEKRERGAVRISAIVSTPAPVSSVVNRSQEWREWPIVRIGRTGAMSEALSSLALGTCAQIGRHRFVGERGDGGVEFHHLLLLAAEPPQRHGALVRLALADNEQHRDLGERMLAHLVV